MNNIDLSSQNTYGGVDMNNKHWKPGEIVPESANYIAYDKNGNNGGTLYLEEGKRFPVTQHSGSYYVKNTKR